MEFYIGQIFDDVYPPESIEWCMNRGDCRIIELAPEDGVRKWKIIETPAEEKLKLKLSAATCIEARIAALEDLLAEVYGGEE